MRSFVVSHNATHVLHDDVTPYALRFGEPFPGPLIPFGARVSAVYPEGSLGHRSKFDPQGIDSVFLGYWPDVHGRFRGDFILAPLMDFSVPEGHIRVRRARRVSPPDVWEFPIRHAFRTLGRFSL